MPKVPYTFSQRLLESLGIILVIFYIGYIFVTYPALPEQIPSHFNFAGEIDAYSSKNSFILVAAISVGLYLLVSVSQRFPSIWNVPKKKNASEEDIARNYSYSLSLLLWTKLEMLLIFWFISYFTAGGSSLPIIFLPLSMFILFGTVGYYTYQMCRKRVKEEEK